jgi:2-dehydropantoate 2-reductase
VKSPVGDINLADPPTITADRLKQPFDLILLSCKAYDLPSAMDAMAPAVGENTMILPFLNGLSHIDALNARLGKSKVLGGWCAISAAMNEEGQILHLQPFHSLSFGEQDGGKSERIAAVAAALSGAKFDALAVDSVMHEMWEKWIFIASAAGITSLMRGTVGDIVAAGAAADGCPVRRMRRDRRFAWLCTGQGGARPLHADPDHAELAVHRIDAARHRGRPADRGRSYRG